MKILFCVIPEKGHLHPMIGPALYLQSRGHEVIFFADANTAEVLRPAGIRNFIFTAATPDVARDSSRGQKFAEDVRNPIWLRRWIKRLLVEQAEAHIPAFREAMRVSKIDIVVADPMLYAALIGAHQEGVPWVTLSNSLNPVLPDTLDSDLLQTVRWLSEERAQLFSRYGMQVQFRGCDAISPLLAIAFTTEEFVGESIPGVEMVGPSLPPNVRGDEPDFAWEEIDSGIPLVYMSLGSQIYYQPNMFETVISAVADRPMQLVLSVGELHGKLRGSGRLPPNVHAVPYAPQLALLARAKVMITHGGANSVMEALSFGVPLLCTPICNDQFHQAYFINKSCAGIELDLAKASVGQTESALRSLLETPIYRDQANRVANSYQRNGALAAAILVEQRCN